MEEISKIKKLANSPALAGMDKMVVNTEWGAFNNTRTVLPTTPYDNKLDRESINPRFQAYEKFISGMYLGEITRNLILSLIDSAPPILFHGLSTPALNAHYGFDTEYMSNIEAAKSLDDVKKVLIENLGFSADAVSDRDAEIVRWACHLVGYRAAKLSGCAVATVLIQTGHAQLGGGSSSETTRYAVGVDGSLISYYPNFEEGLRESLRAIVGEAVEKRTDIGLAKDGSGVGAALCAQQALKQDKKGSLNLNTEEGTLNGMKA